MAVTTSVSSTPGHWPDSVRDGGADPPSPVSTRRSPDAGTTRAPMGSTFAAKPTGGRSFGKSVKQNDGAPLQRKPASTVQRSLQPSPGVTLPSSHSSLKSTTRSPHGG